MKIVAIVIEKPALITSHIAAALGGVVAYQMATDVIPGFIRLMSGG